MEYVLVIGRFCNGSLFLLFSVFYDFDLSLTDERQRSILNHFGDSFRMLSGIQEDFLNTLGFLLFTKRSVNARLEIVDIDELFV